MSEAPAKAKRILIADDHPIVREGLVTLFRRAGFTVVGEAGSVDAVRSSLDAHGPPDLVLLDFDMPGMSGFRGIDALRGLHPDLKIAIISGVASEEVARAAIARGLVGFVPKTFPPEAVVSAAEIMIAGVTYLPPGLLTASPSAAPAPEPEGAMSEREIAILSMVMQGAPNKVIAQRLGLAEVTIKLHVRRILKKLGARNRAEAVAAAIRAGILDAGEG